MGDSEADEERYGELDDDEPWMTALRNHEREFQQMQAEIERLRDDRDEYKILYADALRDYVKKRDKIERLEKALRTIEGWANSGDAGSYYPETVYEMIGKIARRALENRDERDH